MLSHNTGYVALSAVHTLGAIALGAGGDFVHALIALAAASVYAWMVPWRVDEAA